MGGGASQHADLFEDLFERTATGLCVVNRDLRCTAANGAFAQIVEQPLDTLTGTPLRDLMPGPMGRALGEQARQVIESDAPILDRELSSSDFEGTAAGRAWLMDLYPMHRKGRAVGAIVSLRDITHVRHAEQLQQQLAHELDSLYRNAPVGLSAIDRDLRYVRVNQMIADLNAVSIEEMVGRTYREMSPETADAAEPFFERVMEQGRSLRNVELRSTPPADPGVEHVFLVSTEPVRNEHGEVTGQISAVLDITEWRRAEDLSARRLQELEILYASTPIGLCHVDTGLRIVQANAPFACLCGRARESLIGSLLPEVVPAAIATPIAARLEAIARSGDPESDLEVRVPVAETEGFEDTWSVLMHPVKSEDGEIKGIVTVWHDISTMARRQRETAADRDRLAKAQSVAHLGSWEWDLIEGRLWWSPELYEIFGEDVHYAPSYLDFFEHVHHEDRRKARQLLERTLADDKPYRVTYRVVRPDGSQRLVFTTARVERAADGTPARLVGTCQDVTDRAARPRVSHPDRS